MTVLVDTSIWSLVLRRRRTDINPEERKLFERWESLVRKGQAAIIGPIRQEVLSGIRSMNQFEKLRERLDAFDDLPISKADHVEAARLFNRLRGRGITGSPIDLLICAVARRLRIEIFSLDEDFGIYARHLPLRILH